jgi:hypothetical protein
VYFQISPMAARDKCGHALRFANRLKSKKNAAAVVSTQQKFLSIISEAPASGIISPTSSLSPPALATAAATVASHTQSQQHQQSLVQLRSQLEQQQQQPQANAAQRLIFGELLKRYDTMWGAPHLQALAGLHASASPASAAAAASFLRAAAGTLAPAPAGTPQTLMRPLGAPTPAEIDAGFGGHANVTSASPVVAPVAATAPTSAPDSINAVSSVSSPRGDHARKPTLDDLCSLLLAAKNQGS